MKESYLKRYPLSHFVAAVIIVLSLAPFPEMPRLENITLIDKWTHMVMYFGLSITIWWEYFRHHRDSVSWMRIIIGTFILPALFGGLMELAQAYLTTCRSGEWFDFLADSVGSAIAFLIGLGYRKTLN